MLVADLPRSDDPLTFLLALMTDDSVDLRVRAEEAKMSAPIQY
jgi:hypothetical protein